MLSDLPLVEGYYKKQQQTARLAANAVQRVWNGRDRVIPFWDSWALSLPLLTDAVTEAQYANVRRSEAYVQAMTEAQGADVEDSLTYAAFLTPTEVLQERLGAAPARTASLLQQEVDARTANLAGLATLTRFAGTIVQDAGREATGVYTAGTPALKGYYRKLQTPSCDRCAVLAGKWFKSNDGFSRHPRCDCLHVPAAEYNTDELFDVDAALESGQITNLSAADKQAIKDGADLNQVVNSKRGGMQTADLYGRPTKVTSEGTTVRGIAGKNMTKVYGASKVPGQRYRVARTARLRPSAIYEIAGDDKIELQRLLRRYGYLN